MEGSAIPAGQLLSEIFPTSSKSVKPDRHDLAKAQALLKEAGWGDGFRLVLHATSDRYPNDSSVAQAIAQMWTRLGIKAEVEALPGAVFFTRASKQEFSAFSAQYGAEDSMNSLRALVATYDTSKGYGTANRTRYSNPVVDNLLTESLTTMDDELRQRKLERAINFAIADQPLIPVFFPSFDFAAKKGLVVTPRAQRRFNAMMVVPAK
jgi:peptide/nickel transport system substrate-binding protein